MLVILSPLGLLGWPVARLVWALVNVGLSVAIPLLAMRRVSVRTSRVFSAALLLVFMAMLPTRNAIGNGQTTLLVRTAILLALLAAAKRSRWWAGLFLGLALSKFSLTLPVALWFLLSGLGPSLVLAGAAQLLGLLILALASESSPIRIFVEYYLIASHHAGMLGDLDISSLGSHMGIARIPQWMLLGVVFLLTAVLVAWRKQSTRGPRRAEDLAGQDALIACSLLIHGALVLIYHRAYDGVVVILLPVSLFGVWTSVRQSGGRPASLYLVGLLALATVGVFLLPGEGMARIWPAWSAIYRVALGGAALLGWAASALVQVRSNALPRAPGPTSLGSSQMCLP